RRRKVTDQRAIGAQDLDPKLAEQLSLALVVGDLCAVLRILADEGRGAVGPAAIGFDALLHRARRDEGRILYNELGRQVSQRADVVDDPDAAPVRREHEIAIPRLDGEIAHRDRREMATFELCPMDAAIERNPQTELGAEKQQLRIDGIFLDDVRVAAYPLGVLWAEEPRPGLAVV